MTKYLKSKFDMLFTVNDNIKCLNILIPNIFKIRNNKIYFENFNINKNLNTTKVAMYIGTFDIQTNDSSLKFGINSLGRDIKVFGDTIEKSKVIDNTLINFYSNNIKITIDTIIPDTIFYVMDADNNLYQIPFIYNELAKPLVCFKRQFQSYSNKEFGKVLTYDNMSHLSNKINCMYSNVYRLRKLNKQQNLYTMMRLHPEKFPIISSVKKMNLTLPQQRAYSNMWYRQFGTSQALPVNDNFGGFHVVGSDVPYTH